jgi:hypothetical protein
VIDWFPITMRLTVLPPQTQALQAERPDEGVAASKPIESVQHRWWHGHVDEALDRIDSLFIDWDLIRRPSDPADQLAVGIADLRSYIRNHRGSIPNYGETVPAGGDDPHGVGGVADPSGGEPAVGEQAADAVDAERSALAVTDTDEAPP